MTQLKSFFDLMNELSMKSDKKLPNLKVPVKGKKGVSKYMRKKLASTAKDDINASVQSADRKPEKYLKPDGKMGIRMVKVDKEVIKKESIDNHPKVKAARKAHAAGTWDGNVDKEGEAVVHINGKPHTVTNRYGPKKQSNPDRFKPFKKKKNEAINHDDAHRDAQTHSDGSMSVKKIPSMIKKSGDKHLHLHMKSYHKEKDGQDFAKKHGYKVKNYVKTQSGTRMDIHKEETQNEISSYKLGGYLKFAKKDKKKDRTKGIDMAVRKGLGSPGIKKPSTSESVDEAVKNLSAADQVKAALKIIRDKRFNMRSQIDKKTAIQKISKDLLKDPKVKKEMDKIYEETVNEVTKAESDKFNAKVQKILGKINFTHVYNKRGGMFKLPKNVKHELTVKKNDLRNVTSLIKKDTGEVGSMYKKGQIKLVVAESVDEALTLQQRMKRGRLMKRLKARIKIGRDRARRKMANKKTLEKRSMRQARNQLAKKLTRGIPKRELTFARKQEIEKRLDKPALKARIQRIAKRIFKDVRKKEVQRKKG